MSLIDFGCLLLVTEAPAEAGALSLNETQRLAMTESRNLLSGKTPQLPPR